MFSKLNQQRNNIKNNQAHTPSLLKPAVLQKSRSKSKSRSYSALQKQKTNSSQLFNYQIAWICDHLYQGCFNKNKKHGEGFMILSNGVVVVGNWKNGKMDGYGLFLSPFGGRIHVNFKQGILDGWAIVQFGNNFQIMRFKNDVCDLLRRRFDEAQQLWTQALYTKDGRLSKIIQIQKTQYFNLPTFITDQSLITFYDQVIMKNQTKVKFTKLNKIKINDKFQYYGYTNSQKTPNGLGVIYSNSQIYAGNFKNGSLDQYGMILFQNGLIYKGQIYGGKIWGDGVIYDINLDQTKTVKVCQEGVQLVVMLEDGFHLQSVPFNIGKIPKMPADKGFSSAIQPTFDQIIKYYFRANSTILSNPEDQFSSSQESQNQKSEDQVSNYSGQKQKKPIEQFNPNLNPQIQTGKKQKQILSNPGLLQNKLPKKTKIPSNSDSLAYSMDQQNKKMPQTAHKIPSYAPTFAQISQQTQTNSKYPQYPYLMEFQLNKNILTPYKFSKIGKIVANSLKIAERISFDNF